MAFPKFQWVAQDPGLPNKWVGMKNFVIVQARPGTVDAAGGTPPSWTDYLTGPDGMGVAADIQEAKSDDRVLAMAREVEITNTIIVRFDDRIKEDMQLKWWFNGVWHYARIDTITDIDYKHTFMSITCMERPYQAEAYL